MDLKPGSIVSVGGTCETVDNGKITLNRDQVTVLKSDSKQINSIINESGLEIVCPRQNLILEPVSITALFKKEIVLQAATNKEIKYDVLAEIKNKAIILTGECAVGKEKKILANRLIDVVSVDNNEIKGILSANGTEVICSKNSRKKIVAEADYQKFLKADVDANAVKVKTSLVGKFAKVTGTCIVENYKSSGKKPIIELLDKIVKVTNETSSSIVGITTVKNKNTSSNETITVLCDSEIMKNVYYEESLDLNAQEKKEE
jgi:hypothetical protein